MPEPYIGIADETNLTGIGDNQRSPFSHRVLHFESDDRMGGGSVGTNGENAGSLTDFYNRVGHCSATEGGGQTGHRGAMSETGTVIDIIRPQHRPREFLDNIVVLVSTAC